MTNLYRRIVTMGMISFSAILAWVYCVLAYREKTVYVVGLSLVLVISLYALANAIISLHLAKQENDKRFMADMINQTLQQLIPNPADKQAELDRAIEAERLAKATYVQLRKVNQNLTQLTEASNYNSVKSIDNYTALTLSLKETLTESIANTAKIIIKYNKTDNQNIIDSLNELTARMQDINTALDEISARIDSINIVAQPHVKTVLEDSVLDDTLPEGIDVFSMTTETPKDTAPDITEAEEDAAVNSFFEEFENKNPEEVATDETPAEDSNKMLSQDDIAALFAAAMPAAEAEPELTEPEPINEAPANEDPNRQLTPEEIAALFSANAPAKEPEVEIAPEPVVAEPVNEDPNRQLTPEEIAALFSASKEERTAKTNEDFSRENMPEVMDQSLIDALLGNLDAEVAVTEEANAEEDKIIPFPVAEEPKEEPAPIAEEFDPNRQLSADEIAALFASINGGN
ncbi:MAG: hypothetical protein IJO70_07360 [Lachnospiraceae bacterium]|nr:hypothetical protein [Lachnospiraceae bacterium]